MLLKKKDAKQLAKSAKSIIQTERDSTREKTVSYDEMLEGLSHCSRWGAEQHGNKVFMSGTIYSFSFLIEEIAQVAEEG